MITYNVSELMQDIRIALDENDNSTALIQQQDTDAIAINEIIHSKIEDAAAIICKQAPLSMTDGGKVLSGSIANGALALPSDFLRLAYIKLSTWKRPVVVPITPVDPLYTQMASEYEGVTGNIYKPVAVMVAKPTGLVLELYPSNGTMTASYIPKPAITTSDNLETIALPPKLKPAIVQYSAALTCMALGNPDKAKIYIEYAKALLQ